MNESFLADLAAGLPLQMQWMFCASLATIVWCIVGLTKVMLEGEEDRVYIGPCVTNTYSDRLTGRACIQ